MCEFSLDRNRKLKEKEILSPKGTRESIERQIAVRWIQCRMFRGRGGEGRGWMTSSDKERGSRRGRRGEGERETLGGAQPLNILFSTFL